MSVESELTDLAEVVRDQVAQGIARDLAIKLLSGIVSQMVDDEQYQAMVQGHLQAIQRLEEADGTSDSEMNEKIAAHFHDLLVEPPESGAN